MAYRQGLSRLEVGATHLEVRPNEIQELHGSLQQCHGFERGSLSHLLSGRFAFLALCFTDFQFFIGED